MSRPRKPLADLAVSVYQGADGRWHAKVPVARRADGTVERQHLRAADEAGVRALVHQVRTGHSAGAPIARPVPIAELTLRDWTERWLNERLPLAGRSPKTIYGYRRDLANHVLPTLGEIALADLDRDLLERHFAHLSQRVSAHTAIAVHRALSSAFSSAITAKAHQGPNPCRAFTITRPEEPEIEPYTLEQARAILRAARRTREPARWAMALSLGFRQSEVLGLKWPDVDLVAGTLTLRSSLNRAIARHGCGAVRRDGRYPCGYKQSARCPEKIGASGLVDKKLKTRATRRTIPLPPSLINDLRSHRADQAARRLSSLADWPTSSYVFTDDHGRPHDPAHDWRAWKSLIRSAGVPDRRLHDARHTAATLLLAEGIDSRTVMVMLGWSEQRTANRYTHVVDAQDRGRPSHGEPVGSDLSDRRPKARRTGGCQHPAGVTDGWMADRRLGRVAVSTSLLCR